MEGVVLDHARIPKELRCIGLGKVVQDTGDNGRIQGDRERLTGLRYRTNVVGRYSHGGDRLFVRRTKW